MPTRPVDLLTPVDEELLEEERRRRQREREKILRRQQEEQAALQDEEARRQEAIARIRSAGGRPPTGGPSERIRALTQAIQARRPPGGPGSPRQRAQAAIGGLIEQIRAGVPRTAGRPGVAPAQPALLLSGSAALSAQNAMRREMGLPELQGPEAEAIARGTVERAARAAEEEGVDFFAVLRALQERPQLSPEEVAADIRRRMIRGRPRTLGSEPAAVLSGIRGFSPEDLALAVAAYAHQNFLLDPAGMPKEDALATVRDAADRLGIPTTAFDVDKAAEMVAAPIRQEPGRLQRGLALLETVLRQNPITGPPLATLQRLREVEEEAGIPELAGDIASAALRGARFVRGLAPPGPEQLITRAIPGVPELSVQPPLPPERLLRGVTAEVLRPTSLAIEASGIGLFPQAGRAVVRALGVPALAPALRAAARGAEAARTLETIPNVERAFGETGPLRRALELGAVDRALAGRSPEQIAAELEEAFATAPIRETGREFAEAVRQLPPARPERLSPLETRAVLLGIDLQAVDDAIRAELVAATQRRALERAAGLPSRQLDEVARVPATPLSRGGAVVDRPPSILPEPLQPRTIAIKDIPEVAAEEARAVEGLSDALRVAGVSDDFVRDMEDFLRGFEELAPRPIRGGAARRGLLGIGEAIWGDLVSRVGPRLRRITQRIAFHDPTLQAMAQGKRLMGLHIYKMAAALGDKIGPENLTRAEIISRGAQGAEEILSALREPLPAIYLQRFRENPALLLGHIRETPEFWDLSRLPARTRRALEVFDELVRMEEVVTKAWGNPVEFVGRNYVKHLWEMPAGDRQAALLPPSLRRLEGSGRLPFEFEREWPTIHQGIGAGLTFRTKNPVDLIMARVAEGARWRGDQVTLEFLRRHVALPGDLAPDGWVDASRYLGRDFRLPPEAVRTLIDMHKPSPATVAAAAELLDTTVTPLSVGTMDVAAFLLHMPAIISAHSVLGCTYPLATLRLARELAPRLLASMDRLPSELMRSPELQDLVRRYYMFGGRPMAEVSEVLRVPNRGILKLPVIGPWIQGLTDVQFGRLVFALKLMSFNMWDNYFRALERGSLKARLIQPIVYPGFGGSYRQRMEAAVKVLDNIGGGLDYGRRGWTQFQKDALRIVFLVPGFRLGRVRLILKALDPRIWDPEATISRGMLLQAFFEYGLVAEIGSLLATGQHTSFDPRDLDFLGIRTPLGTLRLPGSLASIGRRFALSGVSLMRGDPAEAVKQLGRLVESGLSVPAGIARTPILKRTFLGEPAPLFSREQLTEMGLGFAPILVRQVVEDIRQGAPPEQILFDIGFEGLGGQTIPSRAIERYEMRTGQRWAEMGIRERRAARASDPTFARDLRQELERAARIRPDSLAAYLLRDDQYEEEYLRRVLEEARLGTQPSGIETARGGREFADRPAFVIDQLQLLEAWLRERRRELAEQFPEIQAELDRAEPVAEFDIWYDAYLNGLVPILERLENLGGLPEEERFQVREEVWDEVDRFEKQFQAQAGPEKWAAVQAFRQEKNPPLLNWYDDLLDYVDGVGYFDAPKAALQGFLPLLREDVREFVEASGFEDHFDIRRWLRDQAERQGLNPDSITSWENLAREARALDRDVSNLRPMMIVYSKLRSRTSAERERMRAADPKLDAIASIFFGTTPKTAEARRMRARLIAEFRTLAEETEEWVRRELAILGLD